MKKRIAVYGMVVAMSTSGCAGMIQNSGISGIGNSMPVIDRYNMPEGRVLKDDYLECQSIADEQMGVGEGAVSGGAGGAALGAAVGAIFAAMLGGNVGRTAATTAAGGAMYGGASGASQAGMNKRQIVARCLEGRGWSVLSW